MYLCVFCTVTKEVLRNVALHKRSYQVSTITDQYGPHPASLANDGSRQTDYRSISHGCAASRPETNPWWAVDLEVETLVARVDLTNIGDAAGTDLDLLLNECYQHCMFIPRHSALHLH